MRKKSSNEQNDNLINYFFTIETFTMLIFSHIETKLFKMSLFCKLRKYKKMYDVTFGEI